MKFGMPSIQDVFRIVEETSPTGFQYRHFEEWKRDVAHRLDITLGHEWMLEFRELFDVKPEIQKLYDNDYTENEAVQEVEFWYDLLILQKEDSTYYFGRNGMPKIFPKLGWGIEPQLDMEEPGWVLYSERPENRRDSSTWTHFELEDKGRGPGSSKPPNFTRSLISR